LTLAPSFPKQIDLHLHAGQERDQPIDQLVGSFIERGITFLGLLDHSELYSMGDKALRAKFGQLVYHSTPGGLMDFYQDIEDLCLEYQEASIFKGLELPEWEIFSVETGLLERADFLGCHMNTSCHDPGYRHYTKATCGEHLATRANQLLRLCRPLDKPAVLFHPFHRRIQEMRSLAEGGGDPGQEQVLTEEDLDFFFENTSTEHLYVELNFGDIFSASPYPGILDSLGSTCRMLREGGIGFSLGSDYHRTPREFRDPDEIVAALGLGIGDISIIDELLSKSRRAQS